MIYLDGHSTTPLDPRVFDAMKPYFLDKFGNATHGVHRFNWEAEAGVELAREKLAKVIGADPKEITFTSGATESNHLAIQGLADFLKESGRTKILSTGIEHSSVLGALEAMKEKGFEVIEVNCLKTGRVDLEDLNQKLDAKVGLVSIALANHEVGTVQDLKEISKKVHAVGAILHTDAVQTLGKVKFTVDSLGVDLLTISAHKIHGPKGVGALYVRRKNPKVSLKPLYLGGGQERGLRPGTLNVPGIVGFGAAVSILSDSMETEISLLSHLRDTLWLKLKSELPCLIRNGDTENALPHNLNMSVVGVDGAALFGRLKNVAVSNASACLNGVQDYSQVLTVLGVSQELARASIRFGLGRFNTLDEMEVAANEIVQVVKELRKIESEFAKLSGLESKNGECRS